jgi:hypothetical protein
MARDPGSTPIHGLNEKISRPASARLMCCASYEYAKLPGCLDGADSIPRDQLNTVIHEVMRMVFAIPATEEAKVVAISGVITPRSRKRK